jgi:restriction system protein
MAKLTMRRQGELVRAVFQILIGKPEGMAAKDVLEQLGERVKLSEFEQGSYPSAPQSPRYHKITRFATISAVKAGWLEKRKGIWGLTDDGKLALDSHEDPEKFFREAYQLYKVWRASRPGPEPPEEDIEAQAAQVRVTFEQAEEDAWQEISEFLAGMPPFDFQQLAADLLTAMGYHVSWIAPPGKDFGVDIVAHTDPLGATMPRIRVQVKRRAESSVNVEGLRAFMSVLGPDDLGLFVSVGGFTRDAMDEARMQERRKITLIDLEKFFDLWVEHYDKLSEDARRRFPLKPIYFLAPEQ